MTLSAYSRPARWLHGSAALALLVVLHVAAALHHALIRRDGMLARMGLGRPPRKEPTR
jgi:cytochrome b561